MSPDSTKSDPMSDEPVVCIVDDDQQVRTSLEQLFDTVGLRTQAFADASEFLAALPIKSPGCVLIDLRMPGMSGVELQRRLVELRCPLSVIMVTAHAEIPIAVESMQLGAVDFIEKPYSSQRMLDIVQRAVDLAIANNHASLESAGVQQRLESLSPRESEVMSYLIEGKTTKEIAAALSVSLSTIDYHRHNVLEKMNVESVVELARIIERIRLNTDQ